MKELEETRKAGDMGTGQIYPDSALVILHELIHLGDSCDLVVAWDISHDIPVWGLQVMRGGKRAPLMLFRYDCLESFLESLDCCEQSRAVRESIEDDVRKRPERPASLGPQANHPGTGRKQ